MANIEVVGVLLDASGQPWPGLIVDAFDEDVVGRDRLGTAISDGSGRFAISYAPSRYGPAEGKPDICVEVWNSNHTVMVFKTRTFSDVTADSLDIGTARIGSGPNAAVYGRVIDEVGEGIQGLQVVVEAVDGSPTRLLGRISTDAAGRYGMAYSPEVYRVKTYPYPDVRVTVRDKAGVEVLFQTVYYDVAVVQFQIPDIQLARSAVEGWLATLGQAVPGRVSTGNKVELLVDNDIAFRRIVRAIRGAKRSIWITQLAFNPECVAAYAGPTPGAGGAALSTDVMGSALLDTVQNALLGFAPNVKILVCEAPPHGSHHLASFFKDAGVLSNRLAVRGLDLLPQMLHAKMVLIDGLEGFIIGSPFESEYWDSRAHRVAEPRRPNGITNQGRPIHDVSLYITGKVVDDLEDVFIEMWNGLDAEKFGGNDQLVPHRALGTVAGGQTVQVVRTIPAGVIPSAGRGEAGILEAYKRAFAQAERFIYLENQYFSSRAIFEALRSTLESKPWVDVIVVLNEMPDLLPYKGWQNERLKALGYFENHPRLGVFALWATTPSTTQSTQANINQVYVHSKVAIIDDKWATVGSANLDGISQEAGEEFLVLGEKRFVEVNAVLLDGAGGAAETGNVASFRRPLWSELLAVPEADLDTMPPNGWLSIWRARAAANIASLNATTPPSMAGFVLPYSWRWSKTSQLDDLGVDTNSQRLNILKFPVL